MITGEGELVYPNFASALRASELAKPLANTLLLALLTTLISYQLTAAVTDVLLGTKQRRKTSIPTMHTLLLIRQASPAAVLTNLFRIDIFTRLYYWPALPPATRIARDNLSIRPSVALRLLLLLLAAPLINVFSIILALETTSTITFEESGVGGLAFGIAPRSIRKVGIEQANELCERKRVKLGPGDEELSEVYLCSLMKPFQERTNEGNLGEIQVLVRKEAEVFIRMQVGNIRNTDQKQVTVNTEDSVNIMRVRVDEDALNEMLDYGMELMAQVCNADANNAVLTAFPQPDENVKTLQARQLPCDVDDEDALEVIPKILDRLMSFFTIVNANVTHLKPLADGDSRVSVEDSWFDARDMLFLSRRQHNLGVSLLAIVAIAALTVRVLTGVFWNNDVEEGIELIIKETVGMTCCDSLLRDGSGKVVYNRMYQVGPVARFGLVEKGLPEVQRFDGGVVGDQVPYIDLTASDEEETPNSTGDKT